MLDRRKSPALCRTMLEVRSGVDQLDREIVERLGERFRYMDAAARLKPGRDKVRDEARKSEVLAKVRSLAGAHGVPEDLVADLYERLVEASIAYELDRFDGKPAVTS
jgi:isochorismate pyruvate lyase